MTPCRTCELIDRRNRGEAPPWDSIARTPGWDVVHAFGTGVEGWLVLAARRHIVAVAEMTDAEATELGPLIKRVSQALAVVTGCVKTYIAQFAEDPLHPHVHVHVIARTPDQPADQRGPKIFSRAGLPPEECVSEQRMNEIAAAVAELLNDQRSTDAVTVP